jgi:NADPH:quinone reductase-like Zn-dependent oxidoreductase
MQRILGWYREGKVKPTVGASFPFADAAKAHHYIQDRKNVGKVVLVP